MIEERIHDKDDSLVNAIRLSFLHLVAEVLDGLPGELGLLPPEVASTGGLLENGFSEFEITHDHSWSQVEVAEDDPLEILIVHA